MMSQTTKAAPIILASGSRIRADLLRGAGIDFSVITAPVDEDAHKLTLREKGLGPIAQASALAEFKCLAVAKSNPGFVIGADQILAVGDEAMDKANSMAEARERLWALRGKAHQLHCGVVLAKDGAPVWRAAITSTLWMHDFSAEFLDDYLARAGERILWSVGCYQLEGEGVRLFSKIEGDYFAILGLPLLEVLGALREHGAIAR